MTILFQGCPTWISRKDSQTLQWKESAVFSLRFCPPSSQNPYLAVSTNFIFHQRKTLHKFWCHLPCSETLPKLCWGMFSLTMVTFCFTLSRGFVGNVSGASLCQICLSTQTSPNLIYKSTRTSYRSSSKLKILEKIKDTWFREVRINMHHLLDVPLKFVWMPFTRKFNYKSSAISSPQRPDPTSPF